MDLFSSVPYIENDKLSDFAAAAARLLPVSGERSGRFALRELRRRARELRLCHEAVRKRCAGQPTTPAACEWLLDNWYLVQQELLAVRESYAGARRLRQTGGELLIGALCRSLLHAGHGSVTPERCRLYLGGFQSVTPLRRRELLLFPAAL